MRLTEPAVVMQRTTAPEQPRRLVGAVLDNRTLADWGGAVVVENHVNVLRQSSCDGPMSPRLLAALLATPTLDGLYRCLTGSVAVSAYELEALPLPPPTVLKRWAAFDESDLPVAVARYYSG
jgi:adenine-specific DNA-methyltransferase